MKSARKRSPFDVHEMAQNEMKSFAERTLHYFKKTIKSGKKSFKMLAFWIILVLNILKFGSSMVQKKRSGG